jgi:hypothetical protein
MITAGVLLAAAVAIWWGFDAGPGPVVPVREAGFAGHFLHESASEAETVMFANAR